MTTLGAIWRLRCARGKGQSSAFFVNKAGTMAVEWSVDGARMFEDRELWTGQRISTVLRQLFIHNNLRAQGVMLLEA